jgi:putative membrane protein
MEKNAWVWALLIAALVFLVAGLGMGSGMMGFWGMGMGAGFVLMALFWIALIWFIVVLVDAQRDTGEDPRTILKSRYAKGELTKKQYEEMKREIA